MRALLRVAGVVLAAFMVAAFAVLAGCGSGSSGESRLTVYLSAPLSGAAGRDGEDIADGARLALADAGWEAGGHPVRLEVLDAADPGGATDAIAGANARTATRDSTAIAYIGELESGATRTSLPITNEAGLLQVSPAASAVDLTRVAPGSDEIPTETQPSGIRTFGRVIPSDTTQGAAAAVAMKDAGIDRVGVVLGPDGNYLDALIDGFESVTGAPARVSGPPLDALYVPASWPSSEKFGRRAGVAGSAVYGADAAIVGSPPSTSLPPGSGLVSGSQAPSQLAAGDDFIAAFRDAHGRDPGRFASYGYEAMAVVLDSIDRAGDPLDRGSVVDAFFATSDRESLLGTYSIDETGDATLDRVGAYEAVTGGRLQPLPEPFVVP